MHIRVLPLLCMLFVSPLLAQSTDLQIFLTTDKTAVKTGERFHATIRLKNAGPNIAGQVNVLLQIDPAQLANLDGADMMRVDVEPLTPGIKIWAFVSVTDNDTHHVTTFSAQ